jgi:hypothetical protein
MTQQQLPHRPPRTLSGAVLLLAGLSIACGIRYTSADPEEDFFRELTIEGERRPQAPMTLQLEYEQPYGVPVDVQCVVLEVSVTRTPDPTPTETATPVPVRQTSTPTPISIPGPKPTPLNKVGDILTTTVPANPGGSTTEDSTPQPGRVEQEFRAPQFPGRYVVRCYTPQDESNAILEPLVLKSEGTPAE